MNKEKITDIFFDLDHTLWDFDKNSELTFNKILSENGFTIETQRFIEVYAPINLEFWKLYRENSISKTELRFQRLERTFSALGISVKREIIDLLSEQYIQELTGFNHLVENANTILEYLNPKYNLHIITNGFQEVQDKKLRNSGIIDFFDQIINSEMAGVKKPNPLIFELALKNAGTTPEKAVMIGDSLEADILGAQAMGLQTLHLDPYAREEHVYGPIINNLIEIKSYL